MGTAFPISLDERCMLVGRLADSADVVVLSLDGDLDLATAPALEDLLRDLTRDPQLTVIVDLSELAFCDVTGLRALRAAREAAGGRVALDGPPPFIVRLLRLLGAEDWLAVTPRSTVGAGTLSRTGAPAPHP